MLFFLFTNQEIKIWDPELENIVYINVLIIMIIK